MASQSYPGSIHWREIARSPVVVAILAGVVPMTDAQEAKPPLPSASALIVNGLPSPVTDQHFELLKDNSPFTRSLNLSDRLILTGIADVNGKPVATLMNKETKETYVVSEQPNLQGWKMVELAGNDDLERVSAKISIAGGEVVTVRYDEWSLKPGEARPAGGGTSMVNDAPRPPSGSFGSRRRGGFGGGPDPEIREKMMSLSEDQRRKLFEQMREKMQSNPNMSSDDRRDLFRKSLDQFQK